MSSANAPAESEPPPGRALTAGEQASRGQGGRLAAPGAGPDILGTLLPHAGSDQVDEFRWALVGGIVGLAVLVVAGLITAAIILAALLVPVLYVMYLYEARVYRDAPIPIVGFTLGGGILLGIVVTVLTSGIVPDVAIVASTPFGVSIDVPALLLVGVLLPLLREVVKPWPALILRGRVEVSETIDGLVLGVATGLGFSVAETLIRFSQILTSRGLDTAAAGWIYPLLSVAVFTPLIAGSTTGLITAALWRYRRGATLGPVGLAAIPVALLASVGNALGTELLTGWGLPQIIVLGWELLVTVVVLAYVRVLLVRGLHEEARDLGLPDPTQGAAGAAR